MENQVSVNDTAADAAGIAENEFSAAVSETAEPGVVEVRFPDVPGIPEGFEQLWRIIEEILPCHLKVNYVYWYITWAMMEERFPTWGDVEGHSWGELEKMVK